jgi:anti-sigma B factor antagonist
MITSRTDELAIQQETTAQGQHVIRVRGFITLRNVQQLQQAIQQLRGEITIVEMSAVPYMDSAGLGALMNGYIACQKYGGQFALAAVPQRVRDLLQITKVESLFKIFGTLDEAAASLASTGSA